MTANFIPHQPDYDKNKRNIINFKIWRPGGHSHTPQYEQTIPRHLYPDLNSDNRHAKLSATLKLSSTNAPGAPKKGQPDAVRGM
ncbi:hypothetical protein [Pseudomonas chlororaphis]|uniref:hypothetical protein n=1 Tax=Pseudomonas chlororaphis TaxID=587753 RepID=UPI000F57F3E2|nr:hypothetical protein [Pseudomonas chlororaphis]